MRIIKSIAILTSFIVFLLVAFVTHVLLKPFSPARRWEAMSRLTCLLIKFLRSLLGIKLTMRGEIAALKEKGLLVICRHVGYIDGLILGSLLPVIFVSKKEIKTWPLIGKVVEISGTIFIDRLQKSELNNSLERIAECLSNKLNVLIFPEGTSTDGTSILPFQSSFFGVPIMTKSEILPVTINYQRLDGKAISEQNRNEVYWYNKMGFSKHLWNLLRYKKIEATVTVQEKIAADLLTNTSSDRKLLAKNCHQIICNSFDRSKLFSEIS